MNKASARKASPYSEKHIHITTPIKQVVVTSEFCAVLQTTCESNIASDGDEEIKISGTICDVDLSYWFGVYQSGENVFTTFALFAIEICQQEPPTCVNHDIDDKDSIVSESLISTGTWKLSANAARFDPEESFKVHLNRGQESGFSSQVFQVIMRAYRHRIEHHCFVHAKPSQVSN